MFGAGMKLKIGEVAKRSALPASTIRYYVAQGLLPAPEKTNEKMAFYDEACIDRLAVIGELQEKRYYPLYLIKNILRRMDEGLSLQEAEAVESAVFGAGRRTGRSLLTRREFLKATGLSEKELKEAEKLGVLIPFSPGDASPLYNEDDVRAGRDGLHKLVGLGMALSDLSFWVELGGAIVEKEMALRRKLVSGKPIRENVRMTAELTGIGDFYRAYILRRLFQRQVKQNIQKSLKKNQKRVAKNKTAEKKP